MKTKVMSVVTILSLVIAVAAISLSVLSAAQGPAVSTGSIPSVLNYQGRLADSTGDPVPDGDYGVTFRIYDASTGGTALWSETHNMGTTGGLFNVLLGSINPLSKDIFAGTTYLGVKVGADAEMTPRQLFASVPYAFQSQNANTLNGMASTAFSLAGHSHAPGDAATLDGLDSFQFVRSDVYTEWIGKAFDADRLDGFDSTNFMRADSNTSTSGNLTVGSSISTTKVAYKTPRTHYLSIAGEAFSPATSSIAYSKGTYSASFGTSSEGVTILTGSGGGYMWAPVNLPQGATITEFRVYFYDNSTTNDLTVSLYRMGLNGSGKVTMAEVISSGAQNQTLNGYDTSILFPFVENQDWAHLVRASWPNGDTSMKVNGVVITYTIAEAE